MSAEPIDVTETTPVPMWRDGPAYRVILAELKHVLNVTHVIGQALENKEDDYSDFTRHVLMRNVEDPLYALVSRLESEEPASWVPHD